MVWSEGNLRRELAGVAEVWSCAYGPPVCGFAPAGGFVVGGTSVGVGESDAVYGVRTDRPLPQVLWSTHQLDANRFRNACGWSGVHTVPGDQVEENSSWNRELQTLVRRRGRQLARLSRERRSRPFDAAACRDIHSSEGAERCALVLQSVRLRYSFTTAHQCAATIQRVDRKRRGTHDREPRNGRSHYSSSGISSTNDFHPFDCAVNDTNSKLLNARASAKVRMTNKSI